jgi:hypothetical protein
MREIRNAHIVLVEHSEGNSPFRKPLRRYANNIKMKFKSGCETQSCDTQPRPLAGYCEHGNKSSGAYNMRNYVTSRATSSFSRSNLLHGIT